MSDDDNAAVSEAQPATHCARYLFRMLKAYFETAAGLPEEKQRAMERAEQAFLESAPCVKLARTTIALTADEHNQFLDELKTLMDSERRLLPLPGRFAASAQQYVRELTQEWPFHNFESKLPVQVRRAS